MAIYRSGNSYSDTDNGGVNIADAIERLAPKKRGRGRLKPAATRDALGVSIAEAVPTSATFGATFSGIATPLTEQAYGGTTFYTLTSSDGLFVIEYPAYTDYLDADDVALRVEHIDQDA